jgi:hypothetical protein
MAEPGHHPEPEHASHAHPAAPTAGRGYSYAAFGVRVLLTLAGAAGLIIGGFMDWIRDTSAVDVRVSALWDTPESFETRTFVATVGFVTIVLGLLAVLGLAARSGWLTRVAGALGLVVFILFLIQVYRADQDVGVIQAGAWVVLAGSILALVGGFFGSRTAVVSSPPGTVVET